MTTNPETPTSVTPLKVEQVHVEKAMWPSVTGFGVNPTLWPALTDAIRTLAEQRPVTVWSAGCQIGCETYTLAMHLVDAGITNVRIVASDGLAARLELAKGATYYRTELRTNVKMGWLSEEMFAGYFEDAGSGLVRVTDDVRALVEFIDEPVYVPDRVDSADVVMLRNVWVHLTSAERLQLVRGLRAALPADGRVVFRTFYPDEVKRCGMVVRGHELIYGRPTRVPLSPPARWAPATGHDAAAGRPGHRVEPDLDGALDALSRAADRFFS